MVCSMTIHFSDLKQTERRRGKKISEDNQKTLMPTSVIYPFRQNDEIIIGFQVLLGLIKYLCTHFGKR